MRLASYLKKSRHGVYYLRCVLPAASAGPKGPNQSSFSASLGTTDRKKAATVSRVVGAHIARVLPALRAAIRRNDETATAMSAAFKQAMCGWVATLTRGNMTLRIEANPHDPVDQRSASELIARLVDGSTTSTLPMPASAVATATANSPTFNASPLTPITASIEHSLAINRANRKTKTTLEYDRILRDFASWLSKHNVVASASITNAEIAAYKQHLVQVRKHTPKTANKHLAAINTLLRDAQRAGHFPAAARLPTADQMFTKRAVAKVSQSWEPFEFGVRLP